MVRVMIFESCFRMFLVREKNVYICFYTYKSVRMLIYSYVHVWFIMGERKKSICDVMSIFPLKMVIYLTDWFVVHCWPLYSCKFCIDVLFIYFIFRFSSARLSVCSEIQGVLTFLVVTVTGNAYLIALSTFAACSSRVPWCVYPS